MQIHTTGTFDWNTTWRFTIYDDSETLWKHTGLGFGLKIFRDCVNSSPCYDTGKESTGVLNSLLVLIYYLLIVLSEGNFNHCSKACDTGTPVKWICCCYIQFNQCIVDSFWQKLTLNHLSVFPQSCRDFLIAFRVRDLHSSVCTYLI